MNVKERIKKYIESQDLTIVDFEKSINVSNGYVNSISKNIGIEKINKIIEIYPNINLEWLFTGNGQMNKMNDVPEVKFVDNNFLLDRIEKLAIRNNELEKELEKLKHNSKPYEFNQEEEVLKVAESKDK